MDEETIRGWIAAAESDLARLSAEAEEAQRRVARARVQLGLMYELLASVSDEPMPSHPETGASERPVRERVASAAVQILRDYGKPLRIQDIHAEFLRRHLPLPGSGAPVNIAAHLVDRELFTRHARGVYGLAEWGTPASPAQARRSRAADKEERSADR